MRLAHADGPRHFPHPPIDTVCTSGITGTKNVISFPKPFARIHPERVRQTQTRTWKKTILRERWDVVWEQNIGLILSSLPPAPARFQLQLQFWTGIMTAPPYSTNSPALCDGASLSGCFRPYMAAHRSFTVIPFHVLVTNPNHGLSVSVTRASRHMFPQ